MGNKRVTAAMLPCLAGVMLLSACAGTSTTTSAAAPATSLAAAMADAERSVASGDADRAIAILKNAGARYPAEKAPWVQIAQMKFDRGSYGEAINHALEALQRDPKDRQGNSIVAVSGLRLSTQALADLSKQNNLGGPLRTEAQQLATLLRSSLGEEILVPSTQKTVRAKPRNVTVNSGAQGHKPTAAVTTQSNSADPFGALK